MTPLGWQLSARQWDLLTGAVALEGYPAPIQVRSHGRTALERARIRAEVREKLSRLGLMRAGRVDADLEAALRLLHQPASWLDSVWLPEAAAEQPFRVLAARDGAVGICALQQPEDPGATVLDVIPAAELVEAVVSRLPSYPPGRSPAVTVALAARPDRLAQHNGGVLISASPARTKVGFEIVEFDTATTASAILDQPHIRAGQIAANLRDSSGRVHRSPVLHWCDNPDGRYQITLTPHADNTRLLTVTPCDPHSLGVALLGLLASLE